MKDLLEGDRVGGSHVIDDGSVIQADASDLRFDGRADQLEIPDLPNVRAHDNPTHIKAESDR